MGGTAARSDAEGGHPLLGQLIEARRRDYHEVFEYDVTGSLMNILSDLGQVGHVKPWFLQKGNVLTEKDGVRYENDRCRRRTKKIEPPPGPGQDEAITHYRWDCRDRLREVILPDGERILLRYDAFARRTEKKRILPPEGDLEDQLRDALEGRGTTTGRKQITTFLWDGDVLCAELVDGQPHRTHVHEPGTFVPLLQQEAGQVHTVICDHLGMPKELVDQSGKLVWSAAHSAWGEIIDEAGMGQVHSPFRLLGQYADEEIGLCYVRFRYFDPEAGRWCSPDPLGIVGGRNLQGFGASPLICTDPLGLASRCPPFNNTMSSWLQSELDVAKAHGVIPLKPGDPGFQKMVESGTVKWAVDTKGNIAFVPKEVAAGIELKHSVIFEGADVIAAGEASILTIDTDGKMIADWVNPSSGHYLPSGDSVWYGAQAMRDHGIGVPDSVVSETVPFPW